MSTNDYIRNVKKNHWKPFNKKLWQRNYYEHIIRNEKSYLNISEYIRTNPLKWQNSSLATIRQEIYRFSHAIFSANPEDRKNSLGKKENEGKLMVIMLDDAHYFEPISEILTSIKQVLSNENIVKKQKYYL